MKVTAEFRSRYMLVSYYNVTFVDDGKVITRQFRKPDGKDIDICCSYEDFPGQRDIGRDAVKAYQQTEHERYLRWRDENRHLLSETGIEAAEMAATDRN